MIKRQRLTCALVDGAFPPSRGEYWIADTKQAGFGLRLWATRSGGKKAYAIRIADANGNMIRKTFKLRDHWRYKFDQAYSGDRSFGEYVDDAREWARDEIDHSKRRATLWQEENYRWRQAGKLARQIPFGRAAQSLFAGMRVAGRNEAYIDRLDKLFETNIPTKLKHAPLCRVSARSVAKSLVEGKISPGSVRILKAFIGQIFERGSSFDGPLARFSEKFAKEFWERWERGRDVRFPELRSLTKDDYRRVFEYLEAEAERWQPALCIRLYFEFGAPLSRLMSAEWKQILGEHWYPYRPDEKIFWFESRERVGETARAVLRRVADFSQRDFGPSRYWFPSGFRGPVGHIRTVDAYWRTTLENCRSRYYPLREFALRHRNLNNPSYLVSFLRQYGETFRQMDNAAELSKILLAVKNQ